jgi:hypothetical protein
MRMRRKLTQMVPSVRVLARMIALVVLVSATTAGAEQREPIVLVGADAAFSDALDDAVLPAGMSVVAVGMLDAPSLADLAGRSRELADQRGASATVWLLPASVGATLVTYDRKVDRLLVRELPYALPLSATQAAEAARMVRTMLRAMRVEGDSDTTPPPVVPISPPAPWLAASIGGAAWFAPPGADRAPAATLTIAWRPRRLGVAVSGVLAPSAEVTSGSFQGEVRDIVVAAEARYALAFAPGLHVVPGAGMALHVVRLAGAFGPGELESLRFDPAIRLGVTGVYGIAPGIDIGVAVSADCLLLRQKYEIASSEILVVPRLQIVTGVFVGLRLE